MYGVLNILRIKIHDSNNMKVRKKIISKVKAFNFPFIAQEMIFKILLYIIL